MKTQTLVIQETSTGFRVLERGVLGVTIQESVLADIIRRVKRGDIRKVIIIPSLEYIYPEIHHAEKRKTLFGGSTHTVPDAAWVFPQRETNTHHEYLLIRHDHERFADLLQVLKQMNIAYEFDMGAVSGNDSVLHVSVDDTASYVGLHNNNQWYVLHKVDWGINHLRTIVQDFTGSSVDPDRVLARHGILKTHHDVELLTALLHSLEQLTDTISRVRSIATAPYQHVRLSNPIGWSDIVAPQIPGLTDMLHFYTEAPHVVYDHLPIVGGTAGPHQLRAYRALAHIAHSFDSE